MQRRILVLTAFACLAGCAQSSDELRPTSQVSIYELRPQDVARFESKSRSGDVEASEALYDYYSLSKLDTEKAFNWLQMAASQGSPRAQYNLSNLLRTYPPKRDFAKADEWLAKAADGGYPPAVNALKQGRQ